jgi:hypothetical protein
VFTQVCGGRNTERSYPAWEDHPTAVPLLIQLYELKETQRDKVKRSKVRTQPDEEEVKQHHDRMVKY